MIFVYFVLISCILGKSLSISRPECPSGFCINIKPKKHPSSRLTGHVLSSSSDMPTCFDQCFLNCKCVSVNVKRNGDECQLNWEDSESASGSMIFDEKFDYYDIQMNFEKTDDNKCPRSPCENSCCLGDPCGKHGTCTELCKHLRYKFNCTCSKGYGGRFCEKDLTSHSGQYPTDVTDPSTFSSSRLPRKVSFDSSISDGSSQTSIYNGNADFTNDISECGMCENSLSSQSIALSNTETGRTAATVSRTIHLSHLASLVTSSYESISAKSLPISSRSLISFRSALLKKYDSRINEYFDTNDTILSVVSQSLSSMIETTAIVSDVTSSLTQSPHFIWKTILPTDASEETVPVRNAISGKTISSSKDIKSTFGSISSSKIISSSSVSSSTVYYKSCKEISEADRNSVNGAYMLQTGNTTASAYCLMKNVPYGCVGAGWTLVMKIDGNKDTFLFDSHFWINKSSFEPNNGQKMWDSHETKLPTYWTVPFTKICLGMKVLRYYRFMMLEANGSSLYEIISNNTQQPTSLGRESWKGIIGSQSALQSGCTVEGFNAGIGLATDSARVRIGMVADDEQMCLHPDSWIGFGGGGKSCNQEENSCGNEADCNADSSLKAHIKAMGYILVK